MPTLALRAPRDAAHPAPHAVHLTGLRSTVFEHGKGPLIVERRDQDFVEGLLADLTEDANAVAQAPTTPEREGGVMRLFQPIQRVFNLVVLEAYCEMPGQPRLDPTKIDSAGVVIRKLDDNAKAAWLKAGTRNFGWDSVDEDADPSFDKRPPAVSLGHPALNEKAPSQLRVRSAGSRKLATSKVPVSEDVMPLFVAPPEVCAAAGKTLLFGNLRVTGPEQTEGEPQAANYGDDPIERQQLRDHLLSYLKAGPRTPLPLPGKTFGSDDLRAIQQGVASRLTLDQIGSLDKLMLFLQQLHRELGAFGTTTEAKSLMAVLARVQVETDRTEWRNGAWQTVTYSAADFLSRAKEVLLDLKAGSELTMPQAWGAVSSSLGNDLFDAMLACLEAQYKSLKPALGRFEAQREKDEGRYVARCFIRLKPEAEGCPPRLVWSEYSDPFTIAPWWESAGTPVPLIPMPDLFDSGQLAKVKPNVAFALPPKLAKLLQADPKDLRDGKGSGGDGIGLGWICSFSIPIITLCAFIVLNIFLQLFALIFFWLPFLKICIPYPKSK